MRSGNPFLARKHRPVVVGHRGVPAVHQENTLAGFRRAVSLGVPAVELDVRLTRDRRAVVLHDATLRRLTGTPKLVANLTWDELSRERIRRELPMGIDARGELVIARYDRQEPIPLLEEVLAEVGGRLAINIELKLDLPRFWQVDVGNVVARLIRDAHVGDNVIVTSFDPRKLRAAGRAHPDLALGFCFDDGMLDFARDLLDRLPPAADPHTEDRRPGHNARRLLNRILDTHLVGQVLGTRVVGAEHTLVGADTVRSLHARGVAIGTHTLFPMGSTTGKRIAPSSATVAEVERLVGLGVDWIETDDPERLLELVG
ncbi:MAG: glycerophosphodiester phosphodiesterase [Deltaproteobacteria bacterium]|nr:glycerophosphodiester phosphodiesterase [Deltaproteobacteria bacterium]MCW5808569.1 glycerophosphodiester phosphodiesterase [Deltaproteobacteria bacterium]